MLPVDVSADEVTLLHQLAADPSRAASIMRPPRSEPERAVTERILREGYAAFNRGDLEAAFGALPEPIEWEFLPQFSQVGMGGTLRGREPIRHMFDEFLADFGYQSQIEGYSDDGRRIAIRVHGTMKTRHSGLEIELVFTQTWDHADGRFIVRERLIEAESGLAGPSL